MLRLAAIQYSSGDGSGRMLQLAEMCALVSRTEGCVVDASKLELSGCTEKSRCRGEEEGGGGGERGRRPHNLI